MPDGEQIDGVGRLQGRDCESRSHGGAIAAASPPVR
jgi:hypothetical protein